jgi:hypothetical protein
MKSVKYMQKKFIVRINTADMNTTYDEIANRHAKLPAEFPLVDSMTVIF